MSCECSGQWHGGVYGVHLFSFGVMNWKTVVNDTQYLAWIDSWRDLAGFPEHMETFLNSLLTGPEGPIIWLPNDERRARAPLFVAAHYGKGRTRQARWYQFGCIYCRHQTTLLYPGSPDLLERQDAFNKLMLFFEPLLRKYLDRLGGSMPPALPQRDLYAHGPLTASMLQEHSVRLLRGPEHPTVQLAPPPPPPYPPPLTLTAPPSPPSTAYTVYSDSMFTDDADASISYDASASTAGSDFKGTWKRFIWDDDHWWHNDKTGDWFFEKTGTTVRLSPKTLGKCCSKSSCMEIPYAGAADDDDDDDGNTEFVTDDGSTVAGTADTTLGLGPPAPPGGGYTSMCTHRHYAHNLYRPGQLPVPMARIPEDGDEIITV